MTVDILQRIVSHKKEEVLEAGRKVPLVGLRASAGAAGRPGALCAALQSPGRVHIIAEIKRASPSKGDIRTDLDPAALASAYEKGGAAAVSVLTDAKFFKGSLDDLVSAKKACSLPVLRKDFIISKYQIYEAAASGADAVLLIVRILSDQQLSDFLVLCKELSMDALVEAHTPSDLQRALMTDATIIGINNRNLASFETDLQNAQIMAASLGAGRLAVAASGISERKHIEQNLKAGISRFLIGESLVKAKEPETFLRHLING